MDEAGLIQAARRGDLDAFNELVLAYQHRVYNLAFRILGDPAAASDATQEAFIAAYQKMTIFRGGSFTSWLLRIVSNRCYDELRRQKRRPATYLEDLVDQDANPFLLNGGESPEESAERGELALVLQGAIATLPPDQRVVLVLSDVDGMAYAEIAATVGVPVGTVKSRLARARGRLRDLLRAQEELLPRAYRLEGEV
jgi:RNA polymerase sigma-70 factor (ECF subfamily)